MTGALLDRDLTRKYFRAGYDLRETAVRESIRRGLAPIAGGAGAQAPAPVIPFLRAAHEHIEPVQLAAINAVIGANVVNSPVIGVPAEGYLRDIIMIVTTSGGVAGSGVLAGDAPWNVLTQIQFLDTNSSPLFGPMEGYDLYLANKYGHNAFASDPANGPDTAVASTNIVNFAFIVRIPVEILANSGFGSLGNQNSAAQYRIRFGLNTLANVYSVTTGLTAPTVNVDLYMSTWTQPDDVDPFGNPQAVSPPNHGTAQKWTKNPGVPLVAGQNTVRVTDVGNLVKTLIFVVRDSSGVRRTLANMPNPLYLNWDGRQVFVEDVKIRRWLMAQRTIQLGAAAITGVEAGVIVYDYTHDVLSHIGDGGTKLYLPTVQATRLELFGTNFTAGSADVLMNSVQVVETDPSMRYVDTSRTAFHPQVGTVNPSQV